MATLHPLSLHGRATIGTVDPARQLLKSTPPTTTMSHRPHPLRIVKSGKKTETSTTKTTNATPTTIEEDRNNDAANLLRPWYRTFCGPATNALD